MKTTRTPKFLLSKNLIKALILITLSSNQSDIPDTLIIISLKKSKINCFLQICNRCKVDVTFYTYSNADNFKFD